VDGPPIDMDEFARWRLAADRALQSAELQRTGELFNWACFAAEQAAQLAVKGLLHGIGEGPWGHDLRGLVESAAAVGAGLGEESLDPAVRLTRHYIPSRYPDAHPAGDAGDNYRRSDADAAIDDARSLVKAVDVVWSSLGGQ